MASKKQPSASIEMGGVLLNPGECIGPYRYEKPIGKGGMADVLLAYDPNGQAMALKVLKASRFRTGRRRFRREFRARRYAYANFCVNITCRKAYEGV